MKKTIVLLALALMLGGCVGPPALTIVSLFSNAASYAFTEKSVTDHGLSLAAHRDCAMWRVFTEGTVCREQEPVILVAGLSNQPQTDAPVEYAALPPVAAPENAVPEELASLVTAAGEEAAEAPTAGSDAPGASPVVVQSPKPVVASVRHRGCSYFVIASFNKEKDARSLVRRHAGLAPQVVAATVEGDRKYRVVVGPFSDRGRESVRRRIESAGLARPWMIAASG